MISERLQERLRELAQQDTEEMILKEAQNGVMKRYPGKTYGPIITHWKCPICSGPHSKMNHRDFPII